jgi:hypothetical protein
MINDIFPIYRTIDDHIDDFEAIGVLLRGKDGLSQLV